MLEWLTLTGLVANLYGSYTYICDTLYGNTRPNRVTFALWSVVPFIAFFASLADGVTWAALPTFAAGFCPLLILLASFKAKDGGYWRLGLFDWICAGIACSGLVFWGVMRDPLWALFFSILADFAAAIPTLRKAWSHPETETAITWFLGAFSGLTAFFAVKEWRLVELAFPVYLVALCLFIYLVVILRRRHLCKA